MKKLFIFLLVGILCITGLAGTLGALAYLEIPDPIVDVIKLEFMAYLEIPDPIVDAIRLETLAYLEIPDPIVDAIRLES